MEQHQRKVQNPFKVVFTYCLFRKSDYENFLCTLLLPRGIKSAAFAIRAFNVEVAQVEDQVSDSRIGAMRLQFWTDALNNTYNDNPPRSPVALELHRVDERNALRYVHIFVAGNQRSFASCRSSSGTSYLNAISSA